MPGAVDARGASAPLGATLRPGGVNFSVFSKHATGSEMIRQANKAWHGVRLGQPDWGEHSHSLALSAELPRDGLAAHLILNAYWEPLDFELPPPGEGGASAWRRWIDTALDAPQDIAPWQMASAWPGRIYRAEARSVVVLFSDIASAEVAR